MSRLTFTGLYAAIDTLLADNVSGDISAADVRQVFKDVADTFQPSDAALTGIPDAALALSTAFTKLAIFDQVSPYVLGSGAIDFTPSVANDDIVCNLPNINQVIFSTTMEGTNGEDITITAFVNGVEQIYRTQATLQGPGNKVDVIYSFPLLLPSPGPNTVDIRARLRTGTGTVTFSESIFIMRYVPGQ